MEELLTVREVAARLRVDDTTEGVLAAITLPSPGTRKKYRIRKATLESIVGRN